MPSQSNDDPGHSHGTSGTAAAPTPSGGIGGQSVAGGLKHLLEELLGTIIAAVAASSGAIRVLSPDRRVLLLAGSVNLPADVRDCESIVDADCGVCGMAVSERDVRATGVEVCAQRCGHRFFGTGCAHVVAAPLEYHGNLAGIITLFFASPKGVPEDLARILRPYAALVGIALENSQLQEENRRLTLLAERQAMANEIHDSLAHTLYYARIRMSLLLEAQRTENAELALKCALDVDEALGSGQKTLREIITHFRSQMDPRGLRCALQTLVDEFRARTNITLEYITRIPDLALPLEHELQVFHIVREALANIAAHSGAKHATLTVGREGETYVFTVEDNGTWGQCKSPADGHYGLMIMRERALRIGGEITVESTAGVGTRVRLKFPGIVPEGGKTA